MKNAPWGKLLPVPVSKRVSPWPNGWSNQFEKVYQGIIIEEDADINLIHLCRLCNHSPKEIVELVNEGILVPLGRVKHKWRLTFTSIEQVKKAKRLQRDFELNFPGVLLHYIY
jgi:chaperone modulatory protein CbpM